eukprot:scaffold144148_cov29-Prasinocladus_malaysianus.AAC.1
MCSLTKGIQIHQHLRTRATHPGVAPEPVRVIALQLMGELRVERLKGGPAAHIFLISVRWGLIESANA